MFEAGIRPVLIGMAGLGDAAKGLRPGQILQTTVQGNSDDIWILLAGQRVSLGKETELTPGQLVRVETSVNDRGAQIQITPVQQSASPPLSPGIAALITGVLEQLGAISAAPYAARLVPESLPRTSQAMRQVLSLFLREDSLGEELGQLAALLSGAERAGAIPQEFSQMARTLFPDDPELSGERLVASLISASKDRFMEALIGRAIDQGKTDNLLAQFSQELRAALASLRQDERLVSWLKSKGQWRTFEQLTGRIAERLAGARLQNLQALDHAYFYLELPLSPDSGIRRAQIHFFGEERPGGKNRFSKENASVVLDLETTRLGPLWVTLRMTGGQCSCVFRTPDNVVARLIEESTDELKSALESAGFRGTLVETGPWDGDHRKETANLMQRFSRIDLNA